MNQPNALILSDDLIFTSRITGAIAALGGKARVVRNVDKLNEAAAAEPPDCLILDLALAVGRVSEVIAALPQSPRPRVIAYGSHVDTAGLRAATDAGCDLVLPRSRFVDWLESDFGKWLHKQ